MIKFIILLVQAIIFAETPLRFVSKGQERESFVETMTKLPDTLVCKLNDLMPHHASVEYSINFCEMIKVKDIAADGKFILTQFKDADNNNSPWLIEGVNRLTIFSKNKKGMYNRQSSVLQVFTTPARVEILWPPSEGLIREINPSIRVVARLAYEGGVETINDNNIKIKLDGTEIPFTLNTTMWPVTATTDSGYILSSLAPTSLDVKIVPKWEEITLNGNVRNIAVSTSATAIGSADKRESNAYWSYTVDTTAPSIKLDGPSNIKVSDSIIRFSMNLSDDHSMELRDVRIRLYEEKNGKWEHLTSHNRFFQSLPTGTHYDQELLAKDMESIFSKIKAVFTGKELESGRYKLEVRARDPSLIDRTHFLKERKLEDAYGKGDGEAIGELFNDFYESKYKESGDNRFNWSVDSLVFEIDNTPPVIISNTTFPEEISKDSVIKKLAFKWQVSEPCTTRWAIDRVITVTDTKKIKTNYYSEAIRGETLTLTNDSLFFDLAQYPETFRDGKYRIRLLAIDRAGYHSDTSYGTQYTIDFTPPIISEMVIPDLVINGATISKGSDKDAVADNSSTLALRFTALNLFDLDTLPLAPENMRLYVEKPGAPDSLLNMERLGINAVLGKSNSWQIASIPGEVFNRGDGRYALRLEVDDNRIFPNTAKRFEQVVKGCIPPKIISPRPFSEVSGVFAITGTAKDPNWVDIIRFSHYEIEYRPTNATEWRTAGITLTGKEPVEEGLLGFLDLTVIEIPEGYYQLRLITFDQKYMSEQGGKNPLGDDVNKGTWAADTITFFHYKEKSLVNGNRPRLTLSTPKESPVNFNGNDAKKFSVRLAGNGNKQFYTKLSIYSPSEELVADTLFRNMIADSSGNGVPPSFARMGLFIYKSNNRWHLRWNGANSSSKFNGFVRLTGSLSDFKDTRKCADLDVAEDPNGTSTIMFNDTSSGEISFISDASSLEINAQIFPQRATQWIFLGGSMISRNGGLFTVGATTERNFWWNGRNRYGFFSPPGKYTVKAVSYGVNGSGKAETEETMNCRFPFGVRIDGISDTLFEMDTSTFYKEMTIRYRPFGSGYLSCFLIDSARNSNVIFMDSSVYGRSDSAAPCTYTWNFNIHENQLIPKGRYRLVLRLKPSLNDSTCALDTSKSFRFRIIKVINDLNIASLNVRGDTTIQYQGGTAAVVSGKSDFRWLAHGTGVSYPDIPFSYTYKAAGSQLVHPHRFQRFTVKARRGFKKVHYKVRIQVISKYHNRRWHGGLIKEVHTYDANRFMTKEQLHLFNFTDSINGSNVHPINFNIATDRDYLKRRAFSNADNYPEVKVYFLRRNYTGAENYQEWDRNALEVITLKPGTKNIGDSTFSMPRTKYFKKTDDESDNCITEKEYEKIISQYSNEATKYSVIASAQQGEFVVILKGNRIGPGPKQQYFHHNISLEVGTRAEIWDKNYTHHGSNSLVNRYSTWDSENSIYYDKGKGLICKDLLNNGFNTILPEDAAKYVSDQHVQIFDFKFLMDRVNSTHFPFLFVDNEGVTNPTLEEPYWEFRLACKPDAGTYKRFGWSYCFEEGKNPNDKSNYTSRITTSDQMQDTMKIEGDKGARAIMVYCMEPEHSGANGKRIDWPITLTGLDSLNYTSTDLLAQKLPATDTSLRFIPRFNGGVRYGPEDSLDKNKNGDIDDEWKYPSPKAIEELSARLKGASSTEYKGEGNVTLKENGEYLYEVMGISDIARFGNNVSSSIKVTSIESTIPLKATDFVKNGTAGVSFVPLSGPPPWSTSDDVNLQTNGIDILDSIDNNGNLRIDEDASGWIKSDPVPFSPHGFSFQQTCNIADGYPKFGLRSDVKSLYSIDPQSRLLKDITTSSAESWRIDIRHINGEPNREFEVTAIDAGTPPNVLNDLYDRFTVKLKDNVFVPKRIVEIEGKAWGDEYRLLVRNGNGWKQVIPVVNRKEINSTTSTSRTLAYWDVGGLCGGNTLLLQVRKNGQVYQAMQTLFAGQFASNNDQSLYSTHSRSRIDLKSGSMSKWGDTAFVSMTPRKLNELTLSSQPNMNPVGPVMELRPSPTTFTTENRPKLTINFTYNEAKSNGWLNANFNLYNLKADGTLDIIENSTTSYFSTDANGSPLERLAGKGAFTAQGETSKGLALMQIAAETDHWSNFASFKRAARTFFVDCNMKVSGKGKSWVDAFRTLDEALKVALSGDTIKASEGIYSLNTPLTKNTILTGGWNNNSKSAIPALRQTIIKNCISIESDVELSGIIMEAGLTCGENIVQLNRCAIRKSINLTNSVVKMVHTTMHDVKISADNKAVIEAENSLFSKVTGWNTKLSGKGNATWNGVICTNPVSTDNPLIDTMLCLPRISPVIDKAICPVSGYYYGLAPDPGFHEFIGDTIYLSANKGNDSSSGKNKKNSLKTISKALNIAKSHDIIHIAEGKYDVPDAVSKPLIFCGSFSEDFSRRTLDPISTVITGNIKINQPLRVSGIEWNSIITVTDQTMWDTCGFTKEGTTIDFIRHNHLLNNCWFFRNREALKVSETSEVTANRLTFARVENPIKRTGIPTFIKLSNSIILEPFISFIPNNTDNMKLNAVVIWPKDVINAKQNGVLSFNPLLASIDTGNLHPLPNSACKYSGVNKDLIGAFEQLKQQYTISKDTTPAIIIRGISGRYSRYNIKPYITFKNSLPTDSCYALLNGSRLQNGIELYDEGKYILEAAIFRNGAKLEDTSLTVTVDFTPPEITISNIPPFFSEGWQQGYDYVWEKSATTLSSEIIVKEQYQKRTDITLNGKSIRKNRISLHNEGQYTISVTAEDSAGNIANERIVFRLLPPGKEFMLIVQSPSSIDSTSVNSVLLKGYINSPTAKLLLNGDTITTTKNIDSTLFTKTLRLNYGINTFNLKALSTVSGKTDEKTLKIIYDTTHPIISLTTPLNGSVIEIDSGIKSIPVCGYVESFSSITKLTITTPYDRKTLSVKQVGSQHTFNDFLFVHGEREQFPIQIIAENRFSVAETLIISIALGEPPFIKHLKPADGSYVSSNKATLSGIVLDPKVKNVSIQNVPASLFQSNDTAYYSGEVSLADNEETIIKITANDSFGLSDTVMVRLRKDTQAPIISITSPSDNTTTGDSIITISGLIDDNSAFIFCNADTLLPPHAGIFSFRNIHLHPGVNTFDLQAKDRAQNLSNIATLTITRIDASVIYVDGSYNGVEEGTSSKPFNTLAKGVNASASNGTIIIKPGTYNESATFKAGQRIQSEKGSVFLNCGTTPFSVNGSIIIEGLILTGNSRIFDGLNGVKFIMNNCSLLVKQNGIRLNNYRAVNISNFKAYIDKSQPAPGGNAISISSSDTIFISNGRLDSCGEAGIAINVAKLFTIRNVLFNALTSEGLQLTTATGKVSYSTFVNNLNGVNAIGGTIQFDNNIVTSSVAGAIKISECNFNAIYSCFFNNNSVNEPGLDSNTSLLANPMFANTSNYDLLSSSPAKTWSSISGEIGWRSTLITGKSLATVQILSPYSGITIDRSIPIRLSQSRHEGDMGKLTITTTNGTKPAYPASENDEEKIWGHISTDRIENGSFITIRTATDLKAVRYGLPIVELEGDSNEVSERFRKDKNNSVVNLKWNNGWLYASNTFGDTLFTLSTSAIESYSDSFFINKQGSRFRLWRYRFKTQASAGQLAKVTSANPVNISALHFIPSPYKPQIKRNGIIRYRLSADAATQIRIFDRAGGLVKEWSCPQGTTGGKLAVNEIPWDGRTTRKIDCVSGVYIVEVKLVDSDGKQGRVRFAVSNKR